MEVKEILSDKNQEEIQNIFDDIQRNIKTYRQSQAQQKANEAEQSQFWNISEYNFGGDRGDTNPGHMPIRHKISILEKKKKNLGFFQHHKRYKFHLKIHFLTIFQLPRQCQKGQ